MRATVLTAWLPATCLLLWSPGCDGEPKLEVTPTQLNYGTIAGDAHMHLTIKNVGDDGFLGADAELDYHVHASEGWIRTYSPDSTTLSIGERHDCTVWVDRDELLQGRNNGWVDITSNGGDVSVMVLVWRDDTPAAIELSARRCRGRPRTRVFRSLIDAARLT